MSRDILESMKNGLIVSCQAEGNDPFNTPEGVALFAKAAEMGGACAIRSCGIDKTNKIIGMVSIPVIGITKASFDDGYVKITRSFEDVKKLYDIGCDMVAIDGTMRFWDGLTGPEFISMVKEKYQKFIMADISTCDEAEACAAAGADCISTTLNRYTPETEIMNNEKPDFDLIAKLSNDINIPVIAEGRISSPEEAKRALNAGAYAVVVGTMITRPRVITANYIKAMKG